MERTYTGPKQLGDIAVNYLARFSGSATKAQMTEYSDLCLQSSKMTKLPYIAMHKRIERLFADRSVDFVLSNLRKWVHEAGKHDKPGMIINARMKQYRERISPLQS